MIRHNWRYKLLALAVALILWNYVDSERNPQSRETFSVPVHIARVSAGYAADVLTPKVSVTIQGLKTVVDSVSVDDVKASIDLAEVRLNHKTVKANVPVRLRLPRAVQADLSVSINPKYACVLIESIETRRMPVEVQFTSQPPLGYSYSSPLLSPGAVDVSGKFSQLAKVKKVVLTLSEDAVGSLNGDYYELNAVDANGSAVAEVKLHPAKVKAKLEMVESPTTRAAVVSPIFEGQPKFPLRVTKYTVTPSSVTLAGRPSTLSKISAVETEKISLEGANSTVTHDVMLKIPRGTKATSSRTVKVTVYIGAD